MKTGIKNRKIFTVVIMLSGILFSASTAACAQLSRMTYIMDMVQHNPGQGLTTDTKFTDAAFGKSFGIEAMVPGELVQTAITYETWDNTLIPTGSAARTWVDNRAAAIDKIISGAKAQGLKIYPFMDIFIVPKTLYTKYKSEITDANGKIDITKTRTKEVLRVMLDGIFIRFPGIDGLVIRTGENYTQDVPYHQGNTPILNGAASHRELLKVLRDEVCVKLNKKIFYRTWDLDNTFSTQPAIYRSVTDSIPTHANLIFSVKHTAGDFHRRFTFNQLFNVGNHPQIVEVECQREYEGKNAYPNYIARGVIDGFEEYNTMMSANSLKCLKQVISASGTKLVGVWTWSRGGGWFGPYLTNKNEFWSYLNTYVMIQWAVNPNRPEEDIFNEFALKRMGLDSSCLPYFRRMCLLSDSAVLRGRSSAAYNVFNVWWTRDQYISGYGDGAVQSAIDNIKSQNISDQILQEKNRAVTMWNEIGYCSRHLRFSSANTLGISNDSLLEVIRASCEYGRLNYSVFNRAWEIQILKRLPVSGSDDRVSKAIADYDFLWGLWRKLKTERPLSATVYTENAFSQGLENGNASIGVGAAVNSYRTPHDTSWPAIPRLYNLVAKASGWTATWARNRENDFASYRLYLDTVPDPTKLAQTVTSAAETTSTFQLLNPKKKYYLRLTTVDKTGLESPYSNQWVDSLDSQSTGSKERKYSLQGVRAENARYKILGNRFEIPNSYRGKNMRISVFDLKGALRYSVRVQDEKPVLLFKKVPSNGVYIIAVAESKN